jgi:hypothetical protein
LFETVCPTKRLTMKFGAVRREEKFYRLEDDEQDYVYL